MQGPTQGLNKTRGPTQGPVSRHLSSVARPDRLDDTQPAQRAYLARNSPHAVRDGIPSDPSKARLVRSPVPVPSPSSAATIKDISPMACPGQSRLLNPPASSISSPFLRSAAPTSVVSPTTPRSTPTASTVSLPLQSTRVQVQPYLPSLHPLITRETLKELDLEAILRNPQLRAFSSPPLYSTVNLTFSLVSFSLPSQCRTRSPI